MALIEIASEALKHRDKPKALEIATRTDLLVTKAMKVLDTNRDGGD
jgi:hypothetical protein